MKRDIEKILNSISVTPLTKQERISTWNHISAQLTPRTKAQSSLIWHIPKQILKKGIAATLIFGMTATTAMASDSARPGDLLFPLDRALESFQLFIYPDSKRDELKIQFALERIGEVQAIIEETAEAPLLPLAPVETEPTEPTPVEKPLSVQLLTTEKQNTSTEEPTTSDQEVAQEEVTDEEPVPEILPVTDIITTADIELLDTDNDDSFDDTTELSIPTVSEVVTDAEEPVPTKLISAAPRTLSEKERVRIELALSTALEYIGEIKGELAEEHNSDALGAVDKIMDELNEQIGSLPKDTRFEVKIKKLSHPVSFEIAEDGGAGDKKLSIRTHSELAQASTDIAEEPLEESDNAIEPASEVTEEDLGDVEETSIEITDGKIAITTKKAHAPTDIDAFDDPVVPDNDTTEATDSDSENEVIESANAEPEQETVDNATEDTAEEPKLLPDLRLSVGTETEDGSVIIAEYGSEIHFITLPNLDELVLLHEELTKRFDMPADEIQIKIDELLAAPSKEPENTDESPEESIPEVPETSNPDELLINIESADGETSFSLPLESDDPVTLSKHDPIVTSEHETM